MVFQHKNPEENEEVVKLYVCACCCNNNRSGSRAKREREKKGTQCLSNKLSNVFLLFYFYLDESEECELS